MSKDEAKVTKDTVKPESTTTVQEQPPAELKIVNPHLTLRVVIAGLAPYERTGLSASVMKTGRGWIRARGLSVTDEGVETVNTPDAGEEVEHEGAKVKADLRVITFTEDCILKSGKTVIVPAPRGPKAADKDSGDAKADAKPKAKAKAEKAAPKAEKVEAKADDTPNNW